jgi:cholesterol transport system auxiliary component
MKRNLHPGAGIFFSLSLAMPFGCALTQKATPIDARYFTPELPAAPSSPAPASAPRTGPAIELRLGRVTAGAHIRERIIYRDSPYEVGFYDARLWTERPDAYLRRALSQALFEEQGLRSVVGGAAPILDVELIRFEEVRKPQHVAAGRISFALRDDRVVRRTQTISVELPIPQGEKTDAPAATAQALGQVLRSAVSQISERVRTELTPSAVSVITR